MVAELSILKISLKLSNDNRVKMKIFTVIPVLLFLLSVAVNAAEKVIIDTDPGVDDALAIVFAFNSPHLEVVGMTSIFGNVNTALATTNALRLLDIVGSDVPVAEGAIKPLYSPKMPPPDYVHGKDGLGEIYLPPPSRTPIEESAAEFIVRTVMEYPDDVTLIVLGPMTNIAIALSLEPDLPRYVKKVVAMGGVLQVMGNVTPVASANIWNDAHAADIVLRTDWDVVLVTADTTRKVRVKDNWLENIRHNGGDAGKFVHRVSQFYRNFYRSTGVLDGFYNHDPTAMAYVINPDLFQTEQRAIRVVTDGISIGHVIAAKERHYGQPGPWFDIPLATITTDVDSDGVMKMIADTIIND